MLSKLSTAGHQPPVTCHHRRRRKKFSASFFGEPQKRSSHLDLQDLPHHLPARATATSSAATTAAINTPPKPPRIHHHHHHAAVHPVTIIFISSSSTAGHTTTYNTTTAATIHHQGCICLFVRQHQGGCLDSGLTAATTKGAFVLIENTTECVWVVATARGGCLVIVLNDQCAFGCCKQLGCLFWFSSNSSKIRFLVWVSSNKIIHS
nr:hypothetical protein [Tanacetum cinerariifolium]